MSGKSRRGRLRYPSGITGRETRATLGAALCLRPEKRAGGGLALEGREAAVDDDIAARHEFRLVTGEKEREPGDVLRPPEPRQMQRLGGGAGRGVLIPVLLALGDDLAGADGVHANAVLRVVERHRARERDDTALGRRVTVHTRLGHEGIDGRGRSEEHTSELQSRQY